MDLIDSLKNNVKEAEAAATDTAVDDAAAPVYDEEGFDQDGVSEDGLILDSPEGYMLGDVFTVEEAQELLSFFEAAQREYEDEISEGEVTLNEDRSDDIARLKNQIEIAKQRRGDTDQVAPVDTAESLDAKPDDELRAQAEGLGIKHRGLSRAAIIEKILEAPTEAAEGASVPADLSTFRVGPAAPTFDFNRPTFKPRTMTPNQQRELHDFANPLTGRKPTRGEVLDKYDEIMQTTPEERLARRQQAFVLYGESEAGNWASGVDEGTTVGTMTDEGALEERYGGSGRSGVAFKATESEGDVANKIGLFVRGGTKEVNKAIVEVLDQLYPGANFEPGVATGHGSKIKRVKLPSDVTVSLRPPTESKKEERPSPPSRTTPTEAAEGEASLDVQDTWGTDPRAWTEEQKEQKESSALDRTKGDERFGVPESATIVTPESKAGQEAVAFGRALGVDVVFVSDLGTVLGGLSVEHDGKPTGVVLVNARTRTEDTAIWAVVAHEIAHSTGIDRLVTELPRDQMEALIKEYLSKPGAAAVEAKLAADPELAHREAVAMFVGEFLADPKVRNEILESNPSLAARILKFVMEVLQKAGIKLDTFTPAQQTVIKELRNKIIPGTPDMANILSRVRNLTNKDLNKEARARQLEVVGRDRAEVVRAVAESIMAEQQAALRELDPKKATEKIQSTGNPVTEDADIISEEEEEALMRELYGLTEATTEEAAPSSEGLNLEYDEGTVPVEPSEGLPENWEDLPKGEKVKVIKRYVKRFIDAQPDTIKEILTDPEFIDQFRENKEYNKAIRGHYH